MYLNVESWARNVNPSTLKIPHSNTWSWDWSFKCGLPSNLHDFRAKPQSYDGYSALNIEDSHSTLRIPPFKYIECWVWSVEFGVISLGPGLSPLLSSSMTMMSWLSALLIGSWPLALLIGSWPSALLIGSWPLALMIGSWPLALLIGSWPSALLIGSWPSALLIWSWPSALLIWSWPLALLIGSWPLALLIGSWPLFCLIGGWSLWLRQCFFNSLCDETL